MKFTVEERSADKYKAAMEEQIKKSTRIYFRLLSGHTMYYDEREVFILDALKRDSIDSSDFRSILSTILKRINARMSTLINKLH